MIDVIKPAGGDSFADPDQAPVDLPDMIPVRMLNEFTYC